MTELKHTPLNAAHRALNARMVDFGGWDMPVNYGSQIDEHHAVRTDAGMFDVSHMCVVDFAGAQARAFFEYAIANNVGKLQTSGKALYSCLLNEDGGVIDDLIVYFFCGRFLPRRRQRRHGRQGHRLVQPPERRARLRSCHHAARAIWRSSPCRARTRARRSGRSCRPARGHGAAQAVQRRTRGRRAVRRADRRAHRLHRRGRFRNHRAGRTRRRALASVAGGRRAPVRARRARHAAPRSRHESVRPGHGRKRLAARCRARLDGRPGRAARLRRPRRAWSGTVRGTLSSA